MGGVLFFVIQSALLQTIKAGYENGIQMRIMKWCHNWISQPMRHSQ